LKCFVHHLFTLQRWNSLQNFSKSFANFQSQYSPIGKSSTTQKKCTTSITGLTSERHSSVPTTLKYAMNSKPTEAFGISQKVAKRACALTNSPSGLGATQFTGRCLKGAIVHLKRRIRRLCWSMKSENTSRRKRKKRRNIAKSFPACTVIQRMILFVIDHFFCRDVYPKAEKGLNAYLETQLDPQIVFVPLGNACGRLNSFLEKNNGLLWYFKFTP
jgi:hypothetical protein